MIKIKLTESRTLPVPESLVNSITKIYRAGFIKLVVDFINKKLSNPKLKPSIIQKYNKLLEQVEQKYSTELADSQSIGFVSDLNVSSVIDNGELVESIPVEQFITAMASWEGLDTYLRGRVKPATFKSRLKRYFKNKGVDDIQFNMEFGSRGTTRQKDYAGLYESDVDSIIITFNASFFVPTPTEGGEAAPGLSVGSRSIEGILDNIDTELEDTGTSVRHELQHLFQNTISTVLGAGEWQVGLPPKKVVAGASGDEKHYMIPIEMQTDIQDEIDKFLSYVNKFKEKNADKSSIFPQAIKIFIKLFTDSKLDDQESKFAIDNKLGAYITASDLFRDIKSQDKSGQLRKYALSLLYTSVSKQLQESIIMDKIKIVLKENTELLSEDLSKEEIRKLVRDELEKLLKDKDVKKDFTKLTKDFVKKFYKELSVNSTYFIDRIDT